MEQIWIYITNDDYSLSVQSQIEQERSANTQLELQIEEEKNRNLELETLINNERNTIIEMRNTLESDEEKIRDLVSALEIEQEELKEIRFVYRLTEFRGIFHEIGNVMEVILVSFLTG